MAKRVNELREAALAFRKNRNELALKEEAAIKEYQERMKKFNDSIESVKEKREFQRHYHGVMKENARNTVLGDILKGIYIGALEAETLTDNTLILAENMVDQWIIENGGASAIFAKNRGKTYLIDHIISVVEAEADKEVKEIEDDVDDIQDDIEEDKDKEEEAKDDEAEAKEDEAEAKEDSEEAEEDKAEGDEEGFDDAKADEENSEEDADAAADDADETSDDEDEEEKAEEEAPEEDEDAEEDDESEDDDDDPLADPSNIDDDEEEVEEEDPDDVEIEVDDETGEEKVDLDKVADVPQDDSDTLADKEDEEQSDKEFLDDLDQEEDVKKAVELIRVRVADAEENFIKQNAEDKKKMDEILGKISDNVKTVEAISKDDDEEMSQEDEIKESVAMSRIREGKRDMNDITNHRPLSIFEKFTRNVSENIIKDTEVKANFVNESGAIETEYVVETAKVMYAWLETINTLQLENVNVDYLQNVLDNM